MTKVAKACNRIWSSGYSIYHLWQPADLCSTTWSDSPSMASGTRSDASHPTMDLNFAVAHRRGDGDGNRQRRHRPGPPPPTTRSRSALRAARTRRRHLRRPAATNRGRDDAPSQAGSSTRCLGLAATPDEPTPGPGPFCGAMRRLDVPVAGAPAQRRHSMPSPRSAVPAGRPPRTLAAHARGRRPTEPWFSARDDVWNGDVLGQFLHAVAQAVQGTCSTPAASARRRVSLPPPGRAGGSRPCNPR